MARVLSHRHRVSALLPRILSQPLRCLEVAVQAVVALFSPQAELCAEGRSSHTQQALSRSDQLHGERAKVERVGAAWPDAVGPRHVLGVGASVSVSEGRHAPAWQWQHPV